MRCRPQLLFALALALISIAGCKATPEKLMKAVQADNTAEAVKLIAKGVDPNSRTSPNGWSALHYAAMYGNVEIVRALLKAGANPNLDGAKDGQATSPRMLPYSLAEGMQDVVTVIPPAEIEGKLRSNGLDDPVLLKSAKDPKAAERYGNVIALLFNLDDSVDAQSGK